MGEDEFGGGVSGQEFGDHDGGGEVHDGLSSVSKGYRSLASRSSLLSRDRYMRLLLG